MRMTAPMRIQRPTRGLAAPRPGAALTALAVIGAFVLATLVIAVLEGDIFGIQEYETMVLAASLRHPMHVIEAARLGADVATMPFDVFTKLVKHPLTDAGLTKFLSDWKALEAQIQGKEGA